MHSTTRLSSLTCRLMLRNSTPWSTCGVTGSTMNCPMSVRKTCGNSAKALAAHCDECAAGRVSSPLSGNSPHWPLTEIYYAGFSKWVKKVYPVTGFYLSGYTVMQYDGVVPVGTQVSNACGSPWDYLMDQL